MITYKNKIGIIRPCKIGDLIISLPIGKYYFDQGYEVYWPIMQKYYLSFQEVAGHYINFIPITDNNLFVVNLAKQELINKGIENILNLTFNVGTFSDSNSLLFKQDSATFDEFIYKLAKVPFENKWNLDIKRNFEKENEIYSKFVNQENYSVCHFDVEYNKYNWPQGDPTRFGYWNLCKKHIKNKLIEIHPSKKVNSIFYWIKVLENAKQIFAVDSGPANLIEGLGLQNEKYLLIKALDHPKGTPVMKNKWTII